MRIRLKPNDVLMFRESKPFIAGESHLARTTLPLPQTIAGALRSAILLNSNFSEDAKKLAGYKQDEPEFKILGSFFYREDEFFHTPLDIVKTKGLRGYFLIEPLKLPNGRHIFKGRHIHFESVGGFISYDNLVRYLKGDLRDDELEEVVRYDLFVKESRIGIKLSEAKVSEEHLFYRAEFLRLKDDVGISVWIGDKAEEVKKYLGGSIKLGGESRFARVKIDNNNPLEKLKDAWDKILESVNESKTFKLYVATPMLVKNSGNYTWNIEHELSNELKIKIKAIYPLLGKPIAFSGWNYAENRPKPTRYAIPAGSVYFVEFEEGEIELDGPYLKLGELTKLGYGLCFLGVWV